jgi:hypothetical protein
VSNIAAVPNHVAGDTFTAGMWTTLQDDINDGIVNQVCAARVYNTANFPTSGGWTPVPMNTERYDGDNMHSTSTNNTQLVCQTAGIYHIGGCLEYAADAGAGRASIGLRVNGSTVIARGSMTLFSATSTFLVISCDFMLNVGDYVELLAASQNSITVQSDADQSPEFWMHRV